MDTSQQDETKETGQTPAARNIDLTGYKFIYRSEPTFVVPLIDFISGLAPLQSPIAKEKVDKDDKEENKGRGVRQDIFSHELLNETFAFKYPKRFSTKFKVLGNKLGFEDDISQNVLDDAGIKLNKFYWRVYLIYILTLLIIFFLVVNFLLIVPSVAPYVRPTASLTASPIVPSKVPTEASTGAPTGASTETPTTASTETPTGTPTNAPPTESPTASPIPSPTATVLVPPAFGVDPLSLIISSLRLAPITIFVTLIFYFIIIRLGILVAGRFYASTLCLLACINIILELEQDEILSIARLKNRLLNRIDFLARYIPSLGANLFRGDPSVREWTLEYFRTIQKYVRQLERWAIAPKSDTLQVLRKDFYTLAGILLHGNYDEIDWVAETSTFQDKPQTAGQRIGSIFQGFISIGIPILLVLAVVVLPPDLFQKLGVENRVISLIAIAWFLIAADVNLRLGVIERILDVAKVIRDLK